MLDFIESLQIQKKDPKFIKFAELWVLIFL